MNKDIKTWEDLCNHPDTLPTAIEFINDFEKLIEDFGTVETENAKSALAFLKIRLLISEAYGWNPTFYEKNDWDMWKYGIKFTEDGEPWICETDEWIQGIAFYTKEQGEDFLSHESNVQLVKNLFMIND